MKAHTLRKGAYWLSAVLAAAYVVYVLVLKFLNHTNAGPLGELGQFLLVLASVTVFSIGLFADEAARSHDPH
jgi:hypothetical protein